MISFFTHIIPWRTIVILIMLGTCLVPGARLIHADEFGFVKGIWFEPKPFFANEAVKINSVVYNQTEEVLTGSLILTVDDQPIEKQDFTVEVGGIAHPTVMHTFRQGLQKVELSVVTNDGSENDIQVIDVIALENFMVDIDTDGDRIGNLDDEDDDNDGVSDFQEQIDGTNPLDYGDTKAIREAQERETSSNDRGRSSGGNNNSNNSSNSDSNNNDSGESSAGGDTGSDAGSDGAIQEIGSTIGSIQENIRTAVQEYLESQRDEYGQAIAGGSGGNGSVQNQAGSNLGGGSDSPSYSIDSEGYVVVTGADGQQYRVDQNGNLYPSNEVRNGLLQVGGDSVVYYQGVDGDEYVLDQTGTPINRDVFVNDTTQVVLTLSESGQIIGTDSGGNVTVLGDTILDRNVSDNLREPKSLFEVLSDENISVSEKGVYAGLSALAFVFSQWWLLVLVLLALAYVGWSLYRLVHGVH